MKAFIDRLTDEQVSTFLEKNFPKKKHNSCNFEKHEEAIYVRVDQSTTDESFNFTLEEFGTIGFSHPGRWIRFLYKIFGEEYKEAYIAECAKVFEEEN